MYKSWRKRQRMFLRMVGEYAPSTGHTKAYNISKTYSNSITQSRPFSTQTVKDFKNTVRKIPANSSLTADHCFGYGYVGKQPVACIIYCNGNI